MAWYRSGTVTSVAGTNVITGTGTLWNNPIFGIAAGQMIFVPGAGQVVIYEILAVDSDTKIRVTKNIASAITNSEYAIVTTVSNSMSDLARRTAVQLALYQGLLDDWQQITTGAGNVSIIAPDGSTVVIPSLAKISQDISNKVSQQQLSAIGIGLPSQTSISNFDFQNFVFTSGGNYLAVTTNWLNAPAGVSYPTALAISITVDYITVSSNQIGLTLVPNTAASVNFKVYKVLCVGAPGSRVFTVREEWSSANPVPITGGGTGANTLAGAKSALGITALENDALTASQVANTAWINLTLVNGWTKPAGALRAAYRKVLGLVFVEITVVNGTAPLVATLPVGYRPSNLVILPTTGIPITAGSPITSIANLPRYSLGTDGTLSLFDVVASSGSALSFYFQPV